MTVPLVDLRHRKRVSQSVSPLNEPRQSEKEDTISVSEEEEPTPWPKRTGLKTRVIDDCISELASTDDPDWKTNLGHDDKEDDGPDSADLGTMEEDNTLGADVDGSDREESPQQKKKNKARSPKQKNVHKGKGRNNPKR